MPPSIPLWIAGVASLFGVAFGKMVFGGFGLNIFNPAIAGRAFVYVSFPQQLAVTWNSVYHGFPGGFVHYNSAPLLTTSATMLGQYRTTGSFRYSLWNSFIGAIPGSIGETSALIIILAGLYLILTKTAKWQAMVSTLVGFIGTSLIFFPVKELPYFLFGAGIMFGTVFMVTDPVSQPRHPKALWIYGLLVGFLTVFIRRFSLFAEGFMFALLLANCFLPLIDYFFQQAEKKKKALKAA
jgi:Na+-transporting NADH:ubiquinone oxidoreductase subunit B